MKTIKKTAKRKKIIYLILAALLVLVLILVFSKGKEGGEETGIIDHKIIGEFTDITSIHCSAAKHCRNTFNYE